MAFVGLLLIYLEFYLPGGVMGVGGVILLLLAVVFSVMKGENILHVVFFTFGVIISLAVLIKFTLKRIKIAKQESSVYLESDQKGFCASSYDETVIGKRGKALTDLKPSGHVLIEGKKYQVISKIGYLEKGVAVAVVGGKGAYLFVKQCKEENDL